MALVFLFLFVYYHELLSYYVQCAWQAMRASPVVQHDSFEPLLASVAFAGWIKAMANAKEKWGRECTDRSNDGRETFF